MILAIYENELLVGIILGAPAAIAVYLGWQRTKAKDEAAKEAVEAAKKEEIARKAGTIDTTEARQLWDVLTEELKQARLTAERLENVNFRLATEIWDLRGGVRTVERELGQKADTKAVEQLEQKIDKVNGEKANGEPS